MFPMRNGTGVLFYLPILTMVVLQASQMEQVFMSRLAGSLFRARIVGPFFFQYV